MNIGEFVYRNVHGGKWAILFPYTYMRHIIQQLTTSPFIISVPVCVCILPADCMYLCFRSTKDYLYSIQISNGGLKYYVVISFLLSL